MVRLKHRYLLTELIFADGKVDTATKWGDLLRAVKDGVASAHGDYGVACVMSSIQIKYFNAHTRILLLRISRDHYEMLWSALTLMTSFEQRECLFRVVHLGGTIRSCQKFLLKHQQNALKAMVNEAANPVERQKMEALLEDAIKTTLCDN
eukprot:m.333729 g.333729  ORF g.333729 m.333729 type:complete len:150 (+) comp16522_c0_seq23:203-652(+)